MLNLDKCISEGSYGHIYFGTYNSQNCSIKTGELLPRHPLLTADFFLRYLHLDADIHFKKKLKDRPSTSVEELEAKITKLKDAIESTNHEIANYEAMRTSHTISSKTVPSPKDLDRLNRSLASNQKNLKEAESQLAEIKKLKKSYAFLPQRFDVSRNEKHLFLVTELLGKNLKEHLQTEPSGLSLNKTREITTQLASALHYLDESGVIYPNLTPENILFSLDGNTLKLTNFEQASFKDPCTQKVRYMNPSYETPEYFLEIPLTTSSPIWNLALIAAEIFFNKAIFNISKEHEEILPVYHSAKFEKSYPKDLVEKGSQKGQEEYNSCPIKYKLPSTPFDEAIQNTAFQKKESAEEAEIFLDFLHGMLEYDQSKRLSPLEVLNHPFLNQRKTEQREVKGEKTLEIEKPHFAKGSFSEVFRGVLKGNGEEKECVVKLSKDGKDTREKKAFIDSLIKEDRLLRLLHKHQNASSHIIERLGITNDSDGRIGLVLEGMKESLLRYIQRHQTGLSLEKTKEFTKQLLKGLSVLSDMNVIHLDLKPENILVSLDETTVKISDFGSSCLKEDACHPLHFYVQSRWYRSPEDILEIPFTLATDMWSLGAVIPEMLTNCVLFKGSSEIEMIVYHKLRLQKEPSEHLVSQASKKGQDILKKALKTTLQSFRTLSQIIKQDCLAKNEDSNQTNLLIDLLNKILKFTPNNRPTPAEVLNHPFFKEEIS